MTERQVPDRPQQEATHPLIPVVVLVHLFVTLTLTLNKPLRLCLRASAASVRDPKRWHTNVARRRSLVTLQYRLLHAPVSRTGKLASGSKQRLADEDVRRLGSAWVRRFLWFFGGQWRSGSFALENLATYGL